MSKKKLCSGLLAKSEEEVIFELFKRLAFMISIPPSSAGECARVRVLG